MTVGAALEKRLEECMSLLALVVEILKEEWSPIRVGEIEVNIGLDTKITDVETILEIGMGNPWRDIEFEGKIYWTLLKNTDTLLGKRPCRWKSLPKVGLVVREPIFKGYKIMVKKGILFLLLYGPGREDKAGLFFYGPFFGYSEFFPVPSPSRKGTLYVGMFEVGEATSLRMLIGELIVPEGGAIER